MFGCFRESKFTRKCKKAIKFIDIRIPLIQKKKQAVLELQRHDIANLIAQGLYNKAYDRIQKLLVDTNNALCYEIVHKYSNEIMTQQSALLEQRECPHESKVAVATLIYAAARLSEVPELRELRRLFTDRYGDQIESFVNIEFVQKFQNKSFPMNHKLELMQEIAQQHSVRWDCKSFERKNWISLSSLINESKEKPNFLQIGRPQHKSNMNQGSDNTMQNEDIPCTEIIPSIISPEQVRPETKDSLLGSWFHSSANNGKSAEAKSKTGTRTEEQAENDIAFDRSARSAEGPVDHGGNERSLVPLESLKRPLHLVSPPYHVKREGTCHQRI